MRASAEAGLPQIQVSPPQGKLLQPAGAVDRGAGRSSSSAHSAATARSGWRERCQRRPADHPGGGSRLRRGGPGEHRRAPASASVVDLHEGRRWRPFSGSRPRASGRSTSSSSTPTRRTAPTTSPGRVDACRPGGTDRRRQRGPGRNAGRRRAEARTAKVARPAPYCTRRSPRTRGFGATTIQTVGSQGLRRLRARRWCGRLSSQLALPGASLAIFPIRPDGPVRACCPTPGAGGSPVFERHRSDEGPSFRKADVRKVQGHPPQRRGPGDLPEPASQAAAGLGGQWHASQGSTSRSTSGSRSGSPTSSGSAARPRSEILAETKVDSEHPGQGPDRGRGRAAARGGRAAARSRATCGASAPRTSNG